MVSNLMRKARLDCTINRIGVCWRKNTLTGNPTKCVVEQRLPNWQMRLNFGSYDTEPEAMIARDYGAFLRFSAGEDAATAGGYYADDHPSVYEFEESLAIFESMEDSKLRCDEFKELIPLYYQQPKEKWSGHANPPHKEFCKKTRKDITIAIERFREKYPHKLVASRPTEITKDLPIDKPLVGEIHSTPLSTDSELIRVPQSSDHQSPYCQGRTAELEQLVSGSAPKCNVMPPKGIINKEKLPSVIDTSDYFSPAPDNRLGHSNRLNRELEHFILGAPEYTMRTRTAFVKKEKISSVIDTLNHLSTSADAKRSHTYRGFNADVSDQMVLAGQSPKKSRAKESSRYFGVRFRPDLQKWVAEIRVAEWKTVDKKVWLGTFDSEEGAARAADAARKLLKCKKKRPPNFPCESLAAYSELIPANLNLNNLRDDSMFKEVTLFVKRKAQEYAASFCPNKTACISISTDQILAKYNSLQEPPHEFSLQEDNMSMASHGTSFGSSTYDSYNTQLGVMANDGQWMSPASVTYCSASSSAGTSPDDRKTWFYVDNSYYRQAEMTQIEEQSLEGDWTAVNIQSANPTHIVESGGPGTVWEGQNMATDVQYILPDNDQWLTEVNDLLFPNDNEYFEDQAAMDLVPKDEMLYMDSQNQIHSIGDPSLADWITQQSFNLIL